MSDKIQFVDLPAEDNTNEYDPIVTALIEAGPGKGFPISVPTTEVQKNVRRFSEAARRQDRTARKVSSVIDGANTTVVMKLVDKIVRGKGDESAKVDTEAQSTSSDEVTE